MLTLNAEKKSYFRIFYWEVNRMANSWSGPVRRSQLIAPFGVGALNTIPGGISLITAGLDLWYRTNIGSTEKLNEDEFTIHEWRLEEILDVDHFRLPPDFREPWKWQQENKINFNLIIPAFRFPTWHFCPNNKCRTLTKRTLYERGNRGRVSCPKCGWPMFQVPFLAVCEQGHIQDFPFNEWVHKRIHPACDGSNLKLKSSGRPSLIGQNITCTDCGASRTLFGITNAQGNMTYLSSHLEEGKIYYCQGEMPWFGDEDPHPCSSPIRGALRGAANVYFAQIYSSVFLPQNLGTENQEVIDVINHPSISTLLDILLDLTDDNNEILSQLRTRHTAALARFSDEEIKSVIKAKRKSGNTAPILETVIDEHPDISFRRMEFNVIRKKRKEKDLIIDGFDMTHYDKEFSLYFERVLLLKRLRETQVLAGFTRIYPETDKSPKELSSLLWKNQPDEQKWLPAQIVYGEGIYFELNPNMIKNWEINIEVKNRVKPLIDRYDQIQEIRKLKDRAISPRFVLVHTLAHIIINQLTFESGYSSASLRERLYISNDSSCPMAGCLIYTANGDSEGTLGGLVRMGEPGHFEKTVKRALEKAAWCSSDPICQEIGKYGGQGPDSCNLAACHNCAIVPEPACEEFNRFLDRATLIGEIQNKNIGFFSEYVSG